MTMLSGIRVLEVSDSLVDFGGRMLAELGADVVAVVADETRSEARDIAWHHGKTRLSADDTGAIKALAALADIILDGQRNGDRFGLADIAAKNAAIIHVRVTPFDPTGPNAGRAATDLTLFALSGLMHVTGEPDRAPLKFPGEQTYALTGIQAATAALMGLYARRRMGSGQRIDLTAIKSATLANYREAVMHEWTGRIGRRRGNMLVRGKTGVRQVWPCRDGYVTWSMIDNPSMMRAVVKVMSEHGVAGELSAIDWDNTLVADTAQETIERWQGVVEAFFASQTKAALGAWSLERGWGLSVIHDPKDVRENDHLRARGLFVPVADEASGKSVSLPGPLFHSAVMDAPDRVLKKPVPASQFSGWDAA
jgi:crotonobetainyl-CoA:carnitine CoA-transferase CaiB-like acyl-CoA transferase